MRCQITQDSARRAHVLVSRNLPSTNPPTALTETSFPPHHQAASVHTTDPQRGKQAARTTSASSEGLESKAIVRISVLTLPLTPLIQHPRAHLSRLLGLTILALLSRHLSSHLFLLTLLHKLVVSKPLLKADTLIHSFLPIFLSSLNMLTTTHWNSLLR